MKLKEEHKVEVDSLKAYVTDLTARLNVYIPIKTDPIDTELAQYMNNYPDKRKIKIMFIRQGQGVYLFGSSLVNIKCERHHLQIKIGGGYQAIGDFLDTHTAQELAKYECKNPLLKVGDNQSSLNHTMDKSMSKSIRHADSKSTVRTSVAKTPVKIRGN